MGEAFLSLGGGLILAALVYAMFGRAAPGTAPTAPVTTTGGDNVTTTVGF